MGKNLYTVNSEIGVSFFLLIKLQQLVRHLFNYNYPKIMFVAVNMTIGTPS